MTATEIKIEDLFEKDIRRDINGVIKVDQEDERSVYTELDEYVVTGESRKHFDTFFRNYAAALEEPTDRIGVWISGFFGSGKSHFLKILSYLLANREVHGKTALEFFREKITDPAIFANIEKAVTTGAKDVILFNIDSKANTANKGDEQIVNIFMRAFNDMRGYLGDVFWIADLEEDLEEKGLYEAFKTKFELINGDPWEERRVTYGFEQDDIIEALENCGHMSKEAATRLFENDGAGYTFSVEKFAKKLDKYCKSRGKDHQIIFLVDEVGQYIGENSELMLNLQTIVEELGTKLRGKAWVAVTSQADIDTVTKEHVKSYDFSKIQGRFNTRLGLTSANVDEVIKKRILHKKEEYRDVLASYYAEKQTILRNLLAFSNRAEIKVYKNEDDFVNVYPFVPYQFNLVQKVFDRIRETGFTGKHLAKGERSMLSAFKESTENYCENNVGMLIPFHAFYETIEGFLDPIIARTISHARKNDFLNDKDCELLEILFMIRSIPEIEPNLDNLIVLSISSVDENKLKLKERIVESLRKLEDQNLINKSEDKYYFLTNEEQEINKDIKRVEIEEHQILEEIHTMLYEQKQGICPASHKDYKFNRAIDNREKTVTGADLTIKFLTPLSDQYNSKKGNQQSLSGENLSNIDSTDTLLFILPEDELIDQIRSYLKIEKYLKQNSSNRNNVEIQNILSTKQQNANSARAKALELVQKGVSDSRVFVDNKEVIPEKSSPKERIKEGLDLLIQNVYNKAGYVIKDYENDSEVLRVLRSDDLERFGVEGSEINRLALKEMLDYIQLKYGRSGRVLLSDLKERFMKKPYGWKEMTISGLVAILYLREEIKLRYQSEYLFNDASATAKHLTRRDEADKVVIEIREKTEEEDLKAVKKILNDLFEKLSLPEKEGELYETAEKIFREELSALQVIEGRYEEEGSFPGRVRIEAYRKFLKELTENSDPSSFFRAAALRKTEFEELHADAEPVKNFFNGSQVEIFRRLAHKYRDYSRNIQFLSKETRADIEEVNRILNMEEPYSQIRQLPVLKKRIEVAIQDALSARKKEIRDNLDAVTKELERELSDEIFSDDFKETVLRLFNVIERTIEDAEDCALVQSQVQIINSQRVEAYRQMDRERQTIREEQKKNEYKTRPEALDNPGTPATKSVDHDTGAETKIVPPAAPQRNTEVISNIAFFRCGKMLETEEDVEEYITQLREKLMGILKEKNIRV
ncbi:MAG: BREX system P-loop protein BrxC [Methanosarcina sp.]